MFRSRLMVNGELPSDLYIILKSITWTGNVLINQTCTLCTDPKGRLWYCMCRSLPLQVATRVAPYQPYLGDALLH